MSYEAFRHFADSWGLLFRVFRPGAKQHHEDAANMIFDESEKDG